MSEQFELNSNHSVVSEPDDVSVNGTQRSPIKMLLGVLVVSIAICGAAMNLLSSYITPLGHIFWIFFHIFYIGGLFYYFGKRWKYQSVKLGV